METLSASTMEFRKKVYFEEPSSDICNENLTPLMTACMYGRQEQVQLILKDRPLSVSERDSMFKTALHYCAENDEEDAECARLLLDTDPSIIDIPDDDGHTALHLAVISGNLPLVRLLLKYADPNKRDIEGHSTVHWATVCADIEALELVLRHGGSTDLADVHGGYAVHYAAQMCGTTGVCQSGNPKNVGVKVLQLLLSYGADVHVVDKHGRQPILWAASAGSADAIITLVNGGAKVEARDKDGLTALHCAASRGHVDCVDSLLTLCGANVDVIDSNGCSPLFYAVTLGHADATEVLLEHGADPNRQDGKGRTPPHCGAFKGQLETVRLLLDHGANLWLRNSKGGYPLHDAVRSGRKELVTWLLSLRPDSANYYDDDGKRPLHIAVLNNNIEMCKIILDNGASVNAIMKLKGEKMTPLDVALRKNNENLAKFLKLYGGKPVSKLNKTLFKEQPTLGSRTKRFDTRRNSHSSESINRIHRTGSDRKKKSIQRKGDNYKTKKELKSRMVQVHIRADVTTKTVNDRNTDRKRYSGRGTFSKSQRKRVSNIDSANKDCFSENDLSNDEYENENCEGDDNEYFDDYEFDNENDSDSYKTDEGMEDEHNIDINPSGITSKKGGGMTQSKSEKKRAVSKNNRKRKNKINEAETTETKESTEKVDLKASRLKRSTINNQDQKLENKNSNYNELNEHPSAEFESHYEGDVINYGEITNANSDVDVIKNKTTVSTSNQKAITISDTEIDKNIEQTAYHIEANQKTERGSMRDSNKKNAKVSPIVLKEKTIVGSTSLGGNKTVTFSTKSIDLKTDKKSETLGNSSIAEQLKGQEDFVSPTDFSQDIAVTEKDILKETAIKITSSEDSTVSNKVNSFEKSNIKNNAITEVIDNHNYENQSQLKENNDNNTKFLLKNNMKKLNDINKDSGESKKAKILTYNNITPKDGINKESMTENSEHDHTSGLNGSLGRPFNKAIVEVLDRVDTPEVNNRNVNDQNILQTDSFSVLQSEIVEPPEKYCCCPNCRKKSKNTKSRIPRLNNNCSLAPANDLNTMSVTRAVQISSRKYHIERLIFYQLSELKRLQIRVGKSDERVLVKRLIEEYGRTGTFIGLQRYEGPYSFKRFEKYLYDQLSTLQKQLPFKEGQSVIPHVQSIDEIEKITGALRRINAGKTVVEDPDDCLSCVRSTHRCNHTTHAYTGVPCAAYIPKLKLNHHRMPKLVADRQRFLPDIRQDGPRATRCLRNVDPSKPITLHFENGSCSQVIDLPTDKLDKNKRYFVTLTIKDTDLQEKNRTVTPILSDNNHTLLAHTHAKSF